MCARKNTGAGESKRKLIEREKECESVREREKECESVREREKECE